MRGKPYVHRLNYMKNTQKIIQLMLLCAVIAACGKPQTPGTTSGAAGATPVSVDTTPEPKNTAREVPVQAHVEFDNVRLLDREDGKMWSVRATLINKDSVPINGGEFVIELLRKGESEPFAVHGTQVFFSPAVTPGRTTGFAASVPIEAIKDRPALAGVEVRVRMGKALPPPVIADAWKPMDPKTAPVHEVGEKVLITKDGERIVLPAAKDGYYEAGQPAVGRVLPEAEAKELLKQHAAAKSQPQGQAAKTP